MTQIQETETAINIIITDLQMHTTQSRRPDTFARHVQKVLAGGKPKRVYVSAKDNVKVTDGEKTTVEFHVPLTGMEDVIKKAKESGKTVRIWMPRSGIPIFLGTDAKEKIEALKRKGQM